MQNDDGNLPIHCLSEYPTRSTKVLQYLIQAFPASIAVKNKRGCLPFHLALRNEAFTNVKCLFDANPLVALVEYDDTEIPIWAIGYGRQAQSYLQALRSVHREFHATMGLPEDVVGEIWQFLVPQAFGIALEL